MTKKIFRAIVCFAVFCASCKFYNDSIDDAANAVIDLFRKEDQNSTAA